MLLLSLLDENAGVLVAAINSGAAEAVPALCAVTGIVRVESASRVKQGTEMKDDKVGYSGETNWLPF